MKHEGNSDSCLEGQVTWSHVSAALEQAIRRPFNYAIVDEVDSLLIDEGRNPMLINLKVELPEDRFKVAMEVC